MNQQTDISDMDYTDAIQARINSLQRWRGHIEKAIKRANTITTFTDIVQSILGGHRYLFDNGVSFAIVQLDTGSRGTSVHIHIAGGTYEGMCEIEKIIETFARAVGATKMTTLGRDGFKRRMRPHGWVPTKQTWFVKELN